MPAHRKHPPKNAVTLIQDLAASGHAIIGIAKHFSVSAPTLKRWMEEDDELQEAFDMGRETERQALHASIYQSAMAGKPANVNAFFLLKARHGYREGDPQNVQVAVALTHVLKVTDHGTDAEWAAKAAAQQAGLLADASVQRAPVILELPAPAVEQVNAPEAAQGNARPLWMPPLIPGVPVACEAPTYPMPAPEAWDIPEWRGNS